MKRTGLSNCTREEFVAHVARLRQHHQDVAAGIASRYEAEQAAARQVSEQRASEAAAKLGIDLATHSAMVQRLAQWQAAGYPERSEAERQRIAETPCKSRLADGHCNATGCHAAEKPRCADLARLATESCPGQPCLFGDGRAAVKAEIMAASAPPHQCLATYLFVPR